MKEINQGNQILRNQGRGAADEGVNVPGGAVVVVAVAVPVVVVAAILANRAGTAIPVDGGAKNVEIAGNDC